MNRATKAAAFAAIFWGTFQGCSASSLRADVADLSEDSVDLSTQLREREDPVCTPIVQPMARCEKSEGCPVYFATSFHAVTGAPLNVQNAGEAAFGVARFVRGPAEGYVRVSGANGHGAVELLRGAEGWTLPPSLEDNRRVTCVNRDGCQVQRTADPVIDDAQVAVNARRVPYGTNMRMFEALPNWLVVSPPKESEANATDVVSATNGDWLAVETRGCARQPFETAEDFLPTPDVLAHALYRNTGRTADDCDYTSGTRPECSVRLYEAAWNRWEEEHASNNGPLNVGTVMSMVYSRELGNMVHFAPRGQSLAHEAFGRNLWQICTSEGCNPERLLVFLASKQAWFGRANPGGIPQVDGAWFQEAADEFDLMTQTIAEPTWREEGRGDGTRPYEWATWGRGQPGYEDVRSGRVAGYRLPFAIRYCGVYEGGGYDYVAAVVSSWQDEMLPAPSTAGPPAPDCASQLVSLGN